MAENLSAEVATTQTGAAQGQVTSGTTGYPMPELEALRVQTLDDLLRGREAKLGVLLIVVAATAFVVGFGIRDAFGRRRGRRAPQPPTMANASEAWDRA